jgi:glycine C-acetyltransferase
MGEQVASNKLDWIIAELQGLREQGLYNTIRTIESAQGAWFVVNGRRVLNLCSNNYLGLANHPALRQAAVEAIEKYGVGPAAVRSIVGTLDLHLALERRLAEFKGVPATISFQSGFAANLATVPALVGKEDVIFSDELNHASIIDGSRLSGARIVRYKHSDAADLERVIGETTGYRRALIISDGVFSMDGDIAPLPGLVEVAERHDIMLMVDDAHGEGVLGGGRGVVAHFGLENRVDVEIGTLSKALGVVGGYVAGKAEIVEWLRQRGRPFLFSSAVPAADVAACLAGVGLLQQSSELVDRLWDNARYFQAGLRKFGFDLGLTATPITPVMLGEPQVAQQFSRKLFERDILAVPIVYPTVAKNKSRIRNMVSAAHSRADLDLAVEAYAAVGKEMGVIS